MNKLKLSNVIVNSLAAFCIMLICSCKKDSTSSIPFQGPKNPSFETTDSWFFTYLTSNGAYNGSSMASRDYLSGYLPSNGNWSVNLSCFNTSDYNKAVPDATVYQDNVDLTHSTTMYFDYSFEGKIGSGGGTATAQILFTSNGTQTLWTKNMDNTNLLPIHKLNEAISLPATSSPGRLTFKLSITSGQQGGGLITRTNVVFGIDNISVK